MTKPKDPEAESAAQSDLASLKAALEAAVRERDEHRTATLFMLEDLAENRKQIERSRQEWVRVFDGVRDPIFVHDRELRIVRCNRAYAERAGMPIQEAIGKRYWEVFPKRAGPLPGCHVTEKAEEEEEEEEVRLDSGEIFLSRAFPVRDAAGAFVFSAHIMEDITKRRHAEEQLSKLNRLYTTLSRINMAIVRATSTAELFDRVCEVVVEHGCFSMAWIGVVDRAEQMVTPVAQRGVSPQGMAAIRDSIGRIAEGRGSTATSIRERRPIYTNDYEVKRAATPWHAEAIKQGIRGSATLPIEQGGEIVGVLKLYVQDLDFFDPEQLALLEEIRADISFAMNRFAIEATRRQAETALLESEEKLRTISSSAQDAIVMADNEGRIEFWNPSAERLFGYTAQEAGGRFLHELIVPERLRDQHLSGFEKFKATGQGPIIGKVLELPSLRKDGTEFFAEYSFSAVRLNDQWHAVALVRDITERKQGEEKLRKSAAELKEAQRVALLGNWDLDTETGNVTWSEELYRIFGRDPALLAPGYEEHPRILAPESYARMNAAIEKTRQTGEPYELDLELVCPDGTRKWITARGEARRDFNGRAVGLRGTALDITGRKRAEAEREKYAQKLGRSLEETIRAIALIVEMRDPYTAGHQRRVADLAAAIGKELGLPEEQIHGLHLAGIVHDLGKVQIPAEILSKPGKLTDIEFSLIKTHPQAGYDILKDVQFPWPIAQIVLQHHERLDGSGYPQGLKAEQILFEAKILAVADVVEAMASHRPYRASLGIDKALAEIKLSRGRVYDAAAVDACVKLFREKGFTFAN